MFERTLHILDENILKKMQEKKILLVGVGGVGGHALEALVRLGFLNITIVDPDTIDESNLNRQIITNQKNIGKSKVEEASIRALSINPNLHIKKYSCFLTEANINDIFTEEYDYILDACDTITTKFLLIREAATRKCKVISSMGTGNRINPMSLTITTLDKTYNDPLAASLRTICRKNNFSLKVPVVWSKENPIKVGTRSPGSLMLVPATAGILMAYYILEDIQKTTI